MASAFAATSAESPEFVHEEQAGNKRRAAHLHAQGWSDEEDGCQASGSPILGSWAHQEKR
jgi:hypothetical protein